MKRIKHKPGYLGPAFHSWLEWLEYAEAVVLGHKVPKRPRYLSLNEQTPGWPKRSARQSSTG